ncbi:hypothetical protein C4J85_2656 [Pseudomonas sp. R4-34-07]|nr:hypothetical protein C4J85_2656 [Pseudomonas sp. R4-34-07]
MKRMQVGDTNGLAVPFRFEQVNLVVQLKTTVYLLTSKSKWFSGCQLKCIEEVFEKCLESIATSVRQERSDF